MSYLVGNPDDRLSRVSAQFNIRDFNTNHRKITNVNFHVQKVAVLFVGILQMDYCM